VDRTLRGRVNQNDRGQGQMEKVRPWYGQPSDRGRLKNRTEQCSSGEETNKSEQGLNYTFRSGGTLPYLSLSFPSFFLNPLFPSRLGVCMRERAI